MQLVEGWYGTQGRNGKKCAQYILFFVVHILPRKNHSVFFLFYSSHKRALLGHTHRVLFCALYYIHYVTTNAQKSLRWHTIIRSFFFGLVWGTVCITIRIMLPLSGETAHQVGSVRIYYFSTDYIQFVYTFLRSEV